MGKYGELWLCGLGILVSLLLRYCTSLHSYSGANKPPMYGDYEAQRHWMEITVNLPVSDWYRNTTENDLLYWGLDYPPLTAYHSWLCGQIARFFNSDFVKLQESRGYESPEHKLFMRYSVFIADLVLFVPAICFYFCTDRRIRIRVGAGEETDRRIRIGAGDETKRQIRIGAGNETKRRIGAGSETERRIGAGSDTETRLKRKQLSFSVCIVLALLYPGLILIDHGHFQYNCVSLGLFTWAVAFLTRNSLLLASFCFALSLNYKQMELYHALPFFLYLLSNCVPRPGTNLKSLQKLFKIAAVVVVTFLIMWYPFLNDFSIFKQVLLRLFPLGRGVFEDKVSNFWCSLNVFYKLRHHLTNLEIVRLCTVSTLIALLPSSIDLFLRPSVQKFLIALINSSLAFFLFSFQVHEKSILLTSIPVLLYFPQKPIMCFWFLLISTFSMLPLLIKDELIIAFVALICFYTAAFRVAIDYTYKSNTKPSKSNSYVKDILITLLNAQDGTGSSLKVVNITCKHLFRNRRLVKLISLYVVFYLSLFGCFVLFLCTLILEAPKQYPDLFPLLISVYCCLHFIVFFIYFNVCQFRINQDCNLNYKNKQE